VTQSLIDERVDTNFVHTPAISRPQPETDAPDVEFETVEDVPPEMDRWVGFSGGEDSYFVAKEAMDKGWAHGVVYCDTGSGLAENLDYVRRVCDRHNWPLVIVPPREPYERPAMRYGWPGTDYHSMWFNIAKGAGWGELQNQIDGSLKLVTGVREDESVVRAENITGEVQRETSNFTGWYLSPKFQATDDEVEAYLEEHDLEKNPVYDTVGRSGDCYCMAYGGRDELAVLYTHFPEHYAFIMNTERRVQEYRGRIKLIEDRWPGVIEYVREKLRKRDGRPFMMYAEAIRRYLPAHYEWAVNQPRRRAVFRGMKERTSWIGHGGESDDRLKQAAAQADDDQTSLCDAACESRGVMGVDPTVETFTEIAADALETTQTTLTEATA
jgi:3'-phosphoadenosine 5'-phosphosulfate sulfotransferase (PAPS reductase)/FAD synthetase